MIHGVSVLRPGGVSAWPGLEGISHTFIHTREVLTSQTKGQLGCTHSLSID